MTDAFGEGPRALTSNLYKARVAGNLVQDGRRGRFGEDTLVQIALKLHKSIVDSKAIVFGAALEKFEKLLLAGQAFANLQ